MNKKENIEWDTGRGKRVVEAYQKLVAEEVLNRLSGREDEKFCLSRCDRHM